VGIGQEGNRRIGLNKTKKVLWFGSGLTWVLPMGPEKGTGPAQPQRDQCQGLEKKRGREALRGRNQRRDGVQMSTYSSKNGHTCHHHFPSYEPHTFAGAKDQTQEVGRNLREESQKEGNPLREKDVVQNTRKPLVFPSENKNPAKLLRPSAVGKFQNKKKEGSCKIA